MKLFILRPNKNRKASDDLWEPWYDKAFGYVIRAETETKARKIADKCSKYEFVTPDYKGYYHPWLYEKYSTCKELLVKGKTEMIIQDFAAA